MERYRVVRNVAIVLLLAAAVEFLPQGGRAANTFGAILLVGFAAGLALFGARLYLENRVAIHGLGDRHRALLYGALGVGMVTLTAEPRLWSTGAGKVAFLAILGAVVYALVVVYRYSRSY